MVWIGLLIAAAALGGATVAGLVWRARDGKVKPVAPMAFDFASLGVRPGRTTLLQFSSAFCAPCRATRVICAQVAGSLPEVDHVEVDAESHLDAVRALHVWRTPTVLILDAEGRILGRAQGTPTLAQLRAAIGAVHA